MSGEFRPQNQGSIKYCTLSELKVWAGLGSLCHSRARPDILGPSGHPLPFFTGHCYFSDSLFSVTSNMSQFWSHDSILDNFGLLAGMMKTLYMDRGISCFSGGSLVSTRQL